MLCNKLSIIPVCLFKELSSLSIRMAKWVAKGPERSQERIEERKRKSERRRSEPKHDYSDPSYMSQIKQTEESMDSALQQGLMAATTSDPDTRKRNLPGTSSGPSSKKPKLWCVCMCGWMGAC